MSIVTLDAQAWLREIHRSQREQHATPARTADRTALVERVLQECLTLPLQPAAACC